MDIRRDWHLVVAEKVLLTAVEVVQRTVDTVVEHRKVNTDVPVLAFFPFEIGIDVLARTPYLEIFSVIEIVAEARHRIYRQIAAEVLVAGNTVVGADFQVIEPFDVFHELFLRNTPTHRYGGEIAPLVVLSEFRRTFMAQGCSEKIFTFIVVAYTAEE